MTRPTLKLISAAAILAALSCFVPAASFVPQAMAEGVPPCTNTTNNHCVEFGGGTMKPSPAVEAAQQANVTAVENTAEQIAQATVGAAKDAGRRIGEWGRNAGKQIERMMNGASSNATNATPQGCSPITKPCQ